MISTIADGVIVPVIREGLFGSRPWLKVRHGGQEGWIVKAHAEPVIQYN